MVPKGYSSIRIDHEAGLLNCSDRPAEKNKTVGSFCDVEAVKAMNISRAGTFGGLLRQARLARGWGQRELSRQSGLDASYINRLEGGNRRPGRDAALALADPLGIDGVDLDRWLAAAGHAPMTLLAEVGSGVRTRGGMQGRAGEPAVKDETPVDAMLRLEKIGLGEVGIRRILEAIDTAKPVDREQAAASLGEALAQLAQGLESPVRSAVVPAAGGQHRLLAPAVMQRLLLRVVAEAAEEGIADIIFVLAPGTEETLFKPLEEAMGIAVVPPVRLHCVSQPKPEGLGDAILKAEPLVRNEPFAVLLPDDFVSEDRSRRKYPQALQAMVGALKRNPETNLLAVTPVLKSKVSSYGIARLRAEKPSGRMHRVEMLVEKPDPRHPVCWREPIFRIAGRYLLQPGIFDAVRGLKRRKALPVELTDAIEIMRSKGSKTLAVEVKQAGEDMSRLIGRALNMMQK